MNKFFIMMGHTYKNRVKSKSFVITTLIMLVFIFAVSNLQTFIEMFSGEEDENRIAVLSESETWTAAFERSLASSDAAVAEVYEGTLEEAKQEVEDGKYEAVVDIRSGTGELPEGTYYANQIANIEASEPVRQALQQVKIEQVTEEAGVAPETLQQISAPVSFELQALEERAKSAEELNQTRGIVYIMLFFMYFAVIMYGQMISTEVATEKSSRVMEILISSVSPVSQMFAKIIGIALVGLTQFAIFLSVGYFSIQRSVEAGSASFIGGLGLTEIQPSTIIYAVVFFLLGYLLFATLAATLGSLVSRLEDAQQMTAPMVMLIVAAFMIAMFGLASPDSAFITISSYFPFFTPLIMFLRVGMLDVPIWEVSLSLAVLVGSIALLGWIGARIYRGGVLLYGKSSSLKDLKAALQLSKKEKSS